MKLHHKKTHDESLAGEKVNCTHCHTTFRACKHRLERSKNVFCSKKCSIRWRSKQKSSGNEDFYKDGIQSVNCANCGETTKARPYKLRKNKNIFCNRDCYGEWLSENKKGENHPNYSENVTVECAYCGEVKQVNPSRFERNNRFFCDRKCRGDWQQENRVGEQALAWSGGTAKQNYGKTWTKQRNLALERDFHQCRSCRMSNSESKKKFGQSLHVHHKTPFKAFEDSKKANKLVNLITLCKSCHHHLEWKYTGRESKTVGYKE